MSDQQLEPYQAVLLICMLFMPIVLMIRSSLYYRKYLDAKILENEDIIDDNLGSKTGGFMAGDGFSIRPPLPIEDYSENITVKQAVNNFNKTVRIFWIWSVVGTGLILLLLNLLD